MPIQLSDQFTLLDKTALAKGVYQAWFHLWGSYPGKNTLYVLLAQIQLETGMKSCHNWNLGNVKSRDGDGYDYQFFGCGEELVLSVAQHEAAAHPDLIIIKRTYMKGSTQMASVWIKPEHPWCRFRAFHTLDEGCIDHLSLLKKRFSRSWPAVLAGDPEQFSHLLRAQGYYTADEATYTNSVKQCFNGWAKMKLDLTTTPVDSIDDAMRERVASLVAITMLESIA